MRCHVERGYESWAPCGSTLWVRVTSDMSFLIMAFPIVVQFYARKIVRQQSVCCWRDLCNGPAVWTQYSIVLWTCSLLWHPGCQGSMLTWNVVYWSVLHLILDSAWIWYSLLLELKIPTLAWHWDFLSCLCHWSVYSLQVMRTYSWKLLEKSLS